MDICINQYVCRNLYAISPLFLFIYFVEPTQTCRVVPRRNYPKVQPKTAWGKRRRRSPSTAANRRRRRRGGTSSSSSSSRRRGLWWWWWGRRAPGSPGWRSTWPPSSLVWRSSTPTPCRSTTASTSSPTSLLPPIATVSSSCLLS